MLGIGYGKLIILCEQEIMLVELNASNLVELSLVYHVRLRLWVGIF
jgi:hypothetical protein